MNKDLRGDTREDSKAGAYFFDGTKTSSDQFSKEKEKKIGNEILLAFLSS